LYLCIVFIQLIEFYGWVIFKFFNETTAWFLYLFSEFSFTLLFGYFFITIIKKPQFLTRKQESLSDDFIHTMKMKIDKAIIEDKAYCISELNLTMLASITETSKSDITKYLNTTLNKNFNQFITSNRIEESIIQLKKFSHQEKSIENILHDVGYNSKSVFYSAFKAKVGMTPKQYRKKIEENKH
jgi:AraC-like DNA-binding protein